MSNSNKPRRELRSLREIKKMRSAGLIVWEAHQAAARILRPGISTEALNAVYRETFRRYQAEPLFLNYGEIPHQRPPFPAETCISVNEELVHGIPGSRVLQEGDIVSLDTGCRLSGWCADAAVTHPIGVIDSAKQRLLQVTQGVLDLAIELMGVKNWWSEVAREMHDYVNDAGMGVIKEMVGHGIGKQLHEPPQVPNYFSRHWKDNEDFDLRVGVVLAVEPMVGFGTDQLLELGDKWTIITKDRSPSAHFEHTIAMTQSGPQRLTGPPDPAELAELPEWLQNPTEWVIW